MIHSRTFFIALSVCGASLLLAGSSGDTVSSRIAPPEDFKCIEIADESFAAKLRALKLKPEGTNVLDGQGEEILCDDDIVAVLDERPLKIKESKGAAGVIKLWGVFRWTKGKRLNIRFGLENGQKALWKDWHDGLRPQRKRGRFLFVQTGVPDGSKSNYMRYLKFVAENAGANSLKRDLQIVLPENLSSGDMIISSSGKGGRVGLILDVCKNAKGEKRYLLAMGGDNGSNFYIARPYAPVQGDGAWFTLDGARYAVSENNPTALRRFELEP